MEKVSIILPVYNEEQIILKSLRHLQSINPHEVIVVDGGSKDETVQIIRSYYPDTTILITKEPNRAKQLNLGAREASGDVLLFVHADMELPPHALHCIGFMYFKGFKAGGFYKFYYSTRNWLMLAYAWFLNTIYFGWFKNTVGTNAVFCSKDLFFEIGGYPEQDFLEDVDFSKKLKSSTKIAVVREVVRVSARRYARLGVINQILLNLRIMLGYKFFGQDRNTLRRKYESKQNDARRSRQNKVRQRRQVTAS